MRRITERTFEGIEDTLAEINLSNNKLGDQLNSLFSTGEFSRLTQLVKLDLSGNEIKEFQAGVFNGLVNLQVSKKFNLSCECFVILIFRRKDSELLYLTILNQHQMTRSYPVILVFYKLLVVDQQCKDI